MGAPQHGKFERGPTHQLRRAIGFHGTARALVQFDVSDFPPGGPRGERVGNLRRAFLEGLSKVKADIANTSRNYGDRPFLALNLGGPSLQRIIDEAGLFQFEGRPVPYRVELTPQLFGKALTTAPPGVETIETLMGKLGGEDLDAGGEDYTIIIIDEGVDPASGAIVGAVVDGSHIDGTPAFCPDPLPTGDDPSAGARPESVAMGLDHGTKVTGVASAVAPGASFVSLRVGDGSGAYTTDVITALQEVACRWSDEHSPVAAVVLSMTNADVNHEDLESHTELLTNVIEDLRLKGIPLVIAAGNDALDGRLAFPATLAGSVSVGSVEVGLDIRASHSNWSADLDLCAPGVKVGLQVVELTETGSYKRLVALSGTSFAAPFVAGAIARLRGRFPACDSFTVVDALKRSGTMISRDGLGDVVLDSAGNSIEVALIQLEAAAAVLESLGEVSEEF